MHKSSTILNPQSDEEVYFGWWIDDLLEADLIAEVDRFKLELASKCDFQFTFCESLKTKTKFDGKITSLLTDSSYTGDCKIVWNRSAFNRLTLTPLSSITPEHYRLHKSWFYLLDGKTSYIDVKPEYQNPKHSYRFGEKQRTLFMETGVYVQKIVPQVLFADTFTPSRYLFTDKTRRLRKIKWKVRTLKEFLDRFLSMPNIIYSPTTLPEK